MTREVCTPLRQCTLPPDYLGAAWREFGLLLGVVPNFKLDASALVDALGLFARVYQQGWVTLPPLPQDQDVLAQENLLTRPCEL